MGIFTIIAVIVAVVSGVASYVQAKKAQAAAKKGNDQGILITKQDNNAGLTIIYGERRVGGIKVFKDVNRLAVQPAAGRTLIGQNLNGIDSTYVQKEVRIFLDRVDVIGEGPIHSVTDIEIDGDAWTHKRYGEQDLMSYRGIIMDGSAGQAYLSELGAIYPRWDSTSVGEGVAYVQSRFRNQAGYQVYSGEPNVQYQVKGKLIYDPRKDTTYGGTGSHDAANKSTWEWSDNPSLCLLDYLTNDYGRGLSINEINVPSFITAANSCDTLVDIPAPLTNTTGGVYYRYDRVTGEIIEVPIDTAFPDYRPTQVGTTQKRLTCNIALDPDEEVLNNVKKLLDSMKGNLPYHQGKYSLRLEDAGSSVMAIDEDDIIGGISFGDGDQSERFNRVTVKFPNKSKRFNMDQVSWPKLGSTEYNAYLAEDQDQQLWHEVEVSAVTDFYQAEDIAEYIVRNSRAALSCEVRIKSKGILLEPSDIITLTHSTPSWTAKKFRVRGIKIGTDFTCTLSLSEYQDSVYQWSATANEPDSPDTNMPRPTDPLPALTGLSATVGRVDSAGGVPHGLVTLTWDPVFDFEVDEYTLRYKQTSETVFQVVKFPETTRDPNEDPSLSFTAPQHNVTYDIYLHYTTTSTSRTSTVVTTTITIPEYRTDVDIELHDVELENGLALTDEFGELLTLGDLSDLAVYYKASELILANDIVSSQGVVQGNLDTEVARLDGVATGLQDTLTDLTAATAAVYLQPAAPVAGVSGVPNPIEDNARWYDSDDDNHTYIWDGTVWVSIRDARIGANQAAITALNVELDAAEVDVLANASAISVLDTTVVALDGVVTANSSTLTQLGVDLDAAEVTILGHTGDLSTNATAISGLDTRVTTAEGTITSQSSDLTALTSSLGTTDANVAANTSAATALTTRVTAAEGTITTQSASITSLQSDLDLAEIGVTTNASGISGLETTVTALDGRVTTNATDVTSLSVDLDAAEATILGHTTDLSTNASAITGLSTRVTATESSITSQASDITSIGVDLDAAEVTILGHTGSLATNATAISGLDARTTIVEDSTINSGASLTALNANLSFITEMLGEDGNLLQAENDEDLELENDQSSVVAGVTDASRLLEVRVTGSEAGISTNTQSIVSLSAEVSDPINGLQANASAIDAVELSIASTDAGIAANATAINTLELTVDNASTGVNANAAAIALTDLRVDSTEAGTLANASSITALELTVNNVSTGVAATASALDAVELTVNDAVTGVSAVATRTSGLETTVSDPTTGLETRVAVTEGYGARIDTVDGEIDNLSAEYFVRLDVNDNVSGFGLVNSGTSSEFKILANKFAIVDPAAPTGALAVPFAVSGGVTSMQNVVISGGLMVDNSVTADKILVTDLSAVSANLGTVTAGTLKTATSGYRVEVSDTGDFPIWYGIGSKTAANGLFYVKKDGSVFINAVVNAQAGSSISTLDVEAGIGITYIYSNSPSTAQTLASRLNYIYTNGSGNYTYKWTQKSVLVGGGQTISSTTIQKPVFTTTAVALNGESNVAWEVKVTDTTTGGTYREIVYVRFINVGDIN